jgi:DNA-binding NtrC family response regulator
MAAKHVPSVDDSGCVATQAAPHSPPRILVVEDEQDLRQLDAAALLEAGYQVDVAPDAAAAWAALQQKPYDLLCTNQFLPKTSGVKLLKKIKTAHLGLPVIMATGVLPHWEFTLHTWLQPVKRLLKPHSFEQLLRMVEEVLPRRANVHDLSTPRPPGLNLG